MHPIASLQSEHSLLSRDVEGEVLPACRELGIGFLAYSRLGRGLPAGRYRSRDEFGADDYRQLSPRFAAGVRLSAAELAELERAIPKDAARGERDPAGMAPKWE